jgi:hypothetical protein
VHLITFNVPRKPSQHTPKAHKSPTEVKMEIGSYAYHNSRLSAILNSHPCSAMLGILNSVAFLLFAVASVIFMINIFAIDVKGNGKDDGRKDGFKEGRKYTLQRLALTPAHLRPSRLREMCSEHGVLVWAAEDLTDIEDEWGFEDEGYGTETSGEGDDEESDSSEEGE